MKMNRFSRWVLLMFGLFICLWSPGPSPGTAQTGDKRWVSIGPQRDAVDILLSDPSTPATLYAAARGSGIFKSGDGGNTWRAINAGLTSLEVSALAATPTTPTTLYAGTTVRGIFKSSDGGESWQPLEAPRRGTAVVGVSFLTVDPTSPSTLYAGTTLNCVHKSTDAGATWEELGLCSQASSGMVVDPSDPATLYVNTQGEIRTRPQPDAGAHRVFRSSDGGATWEDITPSPPDREPASLCIASIAMQPVPSPTLYTNLCDGTTYQSATRGDEWHPADLPFTHLRAILTIGHAPAPIMLYARTEDEGRVYHSSDEGQSWQGVSAGLPGAPVVSLTSDAARPPTLYAGVQDTGLFISRDSGESWQDVETTGMNAVSIEQVRAAPTDATTLYATSGERLYRSRDGGTTWSFGDLALAEPEVRALEIDPSDPATLYVGAYNGVLKSTDAGTTWQTASSGLPESATIDAILIHPTTPTILYTTGQGIGIYRSTDVGTTWQAVPAPAGNIATLALATDVGTPAILYAGSTNGGVFRSSDGGANWQAAGLENQPVSLLVAAPSSPSTLYAASFTSHVYRTTDRGNTWQLANSGLPAQSDTFNVAVNALVVDPLRPSVLYAGLSNGGVYQSTDGGGSWHPFSRGLPDLTVTDLVIDPSSSTTTTLYAGTGGNGVARLVLDPPPAPLPTPTPIPRPTPSYHSPTFANDAIRDVWERTDYPVAEQRVARSWLWGPQPMVNGMREPYAEGTDGTRLVQYFHKSRMEINDPDAPRTEWYVTNGLLVVEMMTGRVQVGNNQFEEYPPSDEAVAGDPHEANPDAPTYRSFRSVAYPLNIERPPRRPGAVVTEVLAQDGSVSQDERFADYQVTIATYDENLGHNIPGVFTDFFARQGTVYEEGEFRQGQIMNWQFAVGLPISEPYWARVMVGRTAKDVLMQAFERRVLTYTPDNPADWRVEMGNVGQHYWKWRYEE